MGSCLRLKFGNLAVFRLTPTNPRRSGAVFCDYLSYKRIAIHYSSCVGYKQLKSWVAEITLGG